MSHEHERLWLMAAYASSSSDESNGAPTDFQISSSLESSNGRSSLNLERCAVCSHLRKSFFCPECIRNGDFTHSKAKFPERFAEKKLRHIRLEREKAQLRERIQQRSAPQLTRGAKCQAIKDGRERVELLSFALAEVREQKNQALSTVESMRRECLRVREAIEMLRCGQREMRGQVGHLRSCSQKDRQQLDHCRQQIQRTVREQLTTLTDIIFPIREHCPTSSEAHQEVEEEAEEEEEEEGHSEDEPLLNELQEAQRTTYVRGRWVTIPAPPLDTTYSVVEPRLPADGDYSEYCVWMAQHQESVSPAVTDPRNVGYTYGAGLLFTTQLVSVLALYLDVRLPHYFSFSEFGGSDSSEEAFRHRVAQLNSNVVHLCASQGVDLLLLRPKATLRNLLHLLDKESLGRWGPVEASPELWVSVEDSLCQDLSLCTHESEDEEADDWESIHTPPESPRGSTLLSRQMEAQQTQSSLFSSAAALVTGLWRPK